MLAHSHLGTIPSTDVTLSLPQQLTPVGFDTNSGRWSTFATAGRNSYRIEWLGALPSGKTVLLGVAVNPAGGPRILNLTIWEAYDDGTSSQSTETVNLVCPCLLGVDVRYLAYGTIGLVLLLPAMEVMIHKAGILKRQPS
jgi:hypothetical protein